MTSIAVRYGFFWRTLWQLADNRELAQRRGDPNALAPGDEVVVPSLRAASVGRATDARHKFRRKGTPARFEVQLLEQDSARANLNYTLVVDGVRSEGISDGDGWIREWISPSARRAVLSIAHEDQDDEVYEIDLGHLDPIDTVTGVQGRLYNLGWYTGPVDGAPSEELEEALAAFQREHGLRVTAEADDATRTKLEQLHGR